MEVFRNNERACTHLVCEIHFLERKHSTAQYSPHRTVYSRRKLSRAKQRAAKGTMTLGFHKQTFASLFTVGSGNSDSTHQFCEFQRDYHTYAGRFNSIKVIYKANLIRPVYVPKKNWPRILIYRLFGNYKLGG